MNAKKSLVSIKEIRLAEGVLTQPFNICCVQLRTPFWGETNRGTRGNTKYIGWKESELQARKDKIQTILREINGKYIAAGHKIELIVLPEYSIEEGMIPILQSFAAETRTIIVAGTYSETERHNYAAVIYPHGKTVKSIKQYKISGSRMDHEYLSELPTSKRVRYRIIVPSSRPKERSSHISIYVCHDFLEDICTTIDTTKSGLYIVLMCSPKADDFYGLANYVVRSAKGYRSNVVVLCNASDIPPRKGQKPDEPTACGETQCVGPCDFPLPKKGRYSEGGFIARVNLNSVITKPTRLDRSPVIDNVIAFSINENGIIRDSENVSLNTATIINPNAVLLLLGLYKTYGLFCMKNYSRMLDTLQYLPLQANGVFGIYDILVKSYEEDLEFFETRMNCYLGAKYNDLRDPDLPPRKTFEVTHVVKYRGKQLCTMIDGDIRLVSNFSDLEPYYFERNTDSIKKRIQGTPISKDKEDELIDNGILIRVRSESDIFPEDRERGADEFLVFIDIFSSGDKNISLVNKEFRKEVLPQLLADDRVRTIELCGSHLSEQSQDGSYIVHIVGSLSDVRSIILQVIHGATAARDIRCRSFVVPAAEPISRDRHLYLGESVVRSPQLKKFVRDMVYFLKFVDPKNPFIIKQVPVHLIDKLSQLYSSYKAALKGDPRRSELLNKFNSFVYGACSAYREEGNLNQEIFGRIKGLCMDSFSSVTDKIESDLNAMKTQIWEGVSKHVSEDVKTILLSRVNKDKTVEDVFRSEQTIMGDMIAAIRIWNDKRELRKDKKETLDQQLRDLERVVQYRNYFSHAFRKRLESVSSRDFCDGMIAALESSLLFEQSLHIEKKE